MLDALRIPHLEQEGYEADDIIATLATEAGREGLEVLILTGDRDSLQLVTETCTVLYPMRGVSELARMTPSAVEAKYGVPPARYPELAALVGETSDNLPGVPGRRPGLRRQVDQPVRRPRQRHRPRRRDHRQEGRGAARPPRRRDPQPPAQRAGRATSTSTLAPGRPRAHAVGPAGRSARCFDELEFRGDLRDRLLEVARSREEEPIDESGFELAGQRLAPGEVAALARPPTPPATPAPASPSRAAGAAAPARSGRSRWRPPTAPPPGSTRPR